MGAFYTAFGASSYGGFWVDRRCFTTDAHLQSHFPLVDFAEFVESLRVEGVSYIVMPEEVSERGRFGFSFTAGDNEVPFLHRLVGERGQRIFESGSVSVYRIAP